MKRQATSSPTQRKNRQVTLEVLEELSERAELVEGPGAADSRFFTPYEVKTIDFGPKGGNIHGPNEYVEIDSLRKMPTLYAELAKRLRE